MSYIHMFWHSSSSHARACIQDSTWRVRLNVYVSVYRKGWQNMNFCIWIQDIEYDVAYTGHRVSQYSKFWHPHFVTQQKKFSHPHFLILQQKFWHPHFVTPQQKFWHPHCVTLQQKFWRHLHFVILQNRIPTPTMCDFIKITWQKKFWHQHFATLQQNSDTHTLWHYKRNSDTPRCDFSKEILKLTRYDFRFKYHVTN